MNRIPIANPRANYLAHEAEIRRAILDVLNKNHYVGGEQVTNFEKEFAKFIGTKHAIGVNSGTDALIISMKALDIGRGDEVITVANTAIATVAAIVATGATPVLIDDMEGELPIGPNTKAIIPVHLYGKIVDMPVTDIPIIEDCAQACCNFHRVETFGCFSFYPTKNLGAIGDGGMIVTNNSKLATQCRCIAQYGWNKLRVPQCPGINSRLDPIQAAILRVKLKYLDNENSRRLQIAARYQDGLKDVLDIRLPIPDNHCFHLYVIECDQRDDLMLYLRKKKIQTAIHYPVPIHRQPIYKDLVYTTGLAQTEWRAKHILSLPMYPELTDSQVDRVIDAVRNFYA